MKQDTIERLEAKTPQRRFLHLLEREFHFAPRIGQIRVILARRTAKPGRALQETRLC